MKKIIALLMVVAMLFCFAGCKKTAEQEVITVGYTIYAPMNYFDDDGELIGFDTELATAVFENLGYKVVFKEIKWENKYTDLSSGAIDCIWNGFTCNSADDDGIQRSEKVDFSYNYMENRQVVVVKNDSGITDAAALTGKIAIAESGSAGETYAGEFVESVKAAKKQTDCLMEINAGTANLMIVESLSSDVEYYAIGFEKGSDLTAKVNAELEKLAEDGTIEELAVKYGVENTVIKDFSDQK